MWCRYQKLCSATLRTQHIIDSGRGDEITALLNINETIRTTLTTETSGIETRGTAFTQLHECIAYIYDKALYRQK